MANAMDLGMLLFHKLKGIVQRSFPVEATAIICAASLELIEVRR